MKLTDESLMPFGKYKNEKMANVPSSYLLWLYNNPDPNYNQWSSIRSREVREYIEDNLDCLKQESK